MEKVSTNSEVANPRGKARNPGYEYYTYFSDKVRFGPKPPPNPNAKPGKPQLLVD